MLSHPGRVRAENEDVVLYRIPTDDDARKRGMLALVADGMGGHAAGQVASRIAAQTIDLIYYRETGSAADALTHAFNAANQVIIRRSLSDPGCAGMGTTCTALVVQDDSAWIAHIGDSRAYIVRGEAIHQLTEDHSLVAALVRDGTMSADEAAASPERNIILRALGSQPTIAPLIWKEGLPLVPGDVLVLCSDGLTDLVDDATIAATVTARAPHEACETLIAEALLAGGHDNISVGVFLVSPPATPSDAPTRKTRELDIAALLEEQR